MTTVTRENTIEHKTHQFVADASDLGITARYIAENGWPTHLNTTLGNGQDFYTYHDEVVDGDRLYVKYLQGNGCISLTLFND